jgi:hypothetical protein
MILKAVAFGDTKFGPRENFHSEKNFFFARSIIFGELDAKIFNLDWFESFNWSLSK